MKNLFRNTLLCLFTLILPLSSSSQVAINTDGSNCDPSATLDVKSSDKGVLTPRMTFSQLSSIENPASGLIVFCTDCGTSGSGVLAICIEGVWYQFVVSCLSPISTPVANTHVAYSNQIIWNWNTVSGATGYRWSTINDYQSAQILGNTTSHTESGLIPGTSYTRFVWAYKECGFSQSCSLNQSTLYYSYGGGVTDIDGIHYNTIILNSQEWMVQNLRTGTYSDGTSIPQVTSNTSWSDQSHGAWCWYDNNSAFEIPFGRLYNFYAINDTSHLCPEGWHVPSEAEWTSLVDFMGGPSEAGGKLKEAGTANWYSPNVGATNL